MPADAPILCGRCGYNVRGLPSDVCPECGGDLAVVGTRAGNRTWTRRLSHQCFYWLAAVALPLAVAPLLYEHVQNRWLPTLQARNEELDAQVASDAWPAMRVLCASFGQRRQWPSDPWQPLSTVPLTRFTFNALPAKRNEHGYVVPSGAGTLATLDVASADQLSVEVVHGFLERAYGALPPDQEDAAAATTLELQRLLVAFVHEDVAATNAYQRAEPHAWSIWSSSAGLSSMSEYLGWTKLGVLAFVLTCWFLLYRLRPRRLFKGASPPPATAV